MILDGLVFPTFVSEFLHGAELRRSGNPSPQAPRVYTSVTVSKYSTQRILIDLILNTLAFSSGKEIIFSFLQENLPEGDRLDPSGERERHGIPSEFWSVGEFCAGGFVCMEGLEATSTAAGTGPDSGSADFTVLDKSNRMLFPYMFNSYSERMRWRSKWHYLF